MEIRRGTLIVLALLLGALTLWHVLRLLGVVQKGPPEFLLPVVTTLTIVAVILLQKKPPA